MMAPGRQRGGRVCAPCPRGLATLAGAVAVLAFQACKPSLGDPMAVGSSMAPFERAPYVQAVDTTSAVVVWLAEETARDSFRYRADGRGTWRVASVEAGEDRIDGTNGRLAVRRARLAGLPPGGRVEYEVWAGDRKIGPIEFGVAPRPAAMRDDTVFVLAFGDSGWGSPEQVRLAGLMADERWDLAVHVGDIAYNSGSDQDFTLRHFHIYEALLARVPFFPAPGNHDLRAAGTGPYRRAFVWPGLSSEALYYTYRWGDIRFVVLDTTDESGAGPPLRDGSGPQAAWLESTLREASRDPTVRWLVVYMHHPPYSHATGFAGHGSEEELRERLAPYFERYGVDLVLAGHDHHYERSWPIMEGRRVPAGCGPVYMVTGGGGASQFARAVDRSELTARTYLRHHFVRLVFTRAVILGEAIDTDGEAIDRFGVRAFGAGGVSGSDACPTAPAASTRRR